MYKLISASVSPYQYNLEQLQWGPPYGPLLRNLEVLCKNPTPARPLNRPSFCILLSIYHLNLHPPLQTVGPTFFSFSLSLLPTTPSRNVPQAASRARPRACCTPGRRRVRRVVLGGDGRQEGSLPHPMAPLQISSGRGAAWSAARPSISPAEVDGRGRDAAGVRI
jgi:hypothetical protein